MKLSKLTQAVSIALTALALSACGGSDDGGVIYNTDTTTPTPDTTPTTTPSTDADKLASIITAAKAAGLNDANAQKFAEAVKELAQDSEAYANALAAALEAQKIEIENATKPVSETVKTHNPFIRGVNTAEKLSSGSDFYIRHPGSNYDRGANAGDMSGLGGVATDDPTGDNGNPWLSNFVLGVETVNGQVKAIDSTGEMALPVDGVNRGQKIGAAESWYAKRDGLRYNTNRSLSDNGAYPNARNGERKYEYPVHIISNYRSGDTWATHEHDRDTDYDYSAVQFAPVRSDNWVPSDQKYENEGLWEKQWLKHTNYIPNSESRPYWNAGVVQNGTFFLGTGTQHFAWDGPHTPEPNNKSYGDYNPWGHMFNRIYTSPNIPANERGRYDGKYSKQQLLRWTDDTNANGGFETYTCKASVGDCKEDDSPIASTDGGRGWQHEGATGHPENGHGATNDFSDSGRNITYTTWQANPLGQYEEALEVMVAYWDGNRVYRKHYDGTKNNRNLANNYVEKNGLMVEDSDYDNSLYVGADSIDDYLYTDTPTPTSTTVFRNFVDGAAVGVTEAPYKSANSEEAFGRKIYTIQEINRRKVKVSENAVTDAENFAKAVSQAGLDALTATSQGINVSDVKRDTTATTPTHTIAMDPYYAINGNADNTRSYDINNPYPTATAVEQARRYDTGLIVYNNLSQIVTGDERSYGYKKPIFGIEENVYVSDGNKLKVVNHVYNDELTSATNPDSVKNASVDNIKADKNSFFSVAKEKRMVYHELPEDVVETTTAGGTTTITFADGRTESIPTRNLRLFDRLGYDWNDDYSLFVNGWDEACDCMPDTRFNTQNKDGTGDFGLNSSELGRVNDAPLNAINRTHDRYGQPLKNDTSEPWVHQESLEGWNKKIARRMQPWQRLTVLRESRNPLETGVDAVKVANNLETRVYGKNYRDLETGAEGFQETHNSYTGNFKTNKDADGNEIDHQMTKIAPAKLHHVQYGRITNNIDVLTKAEMDKVKDGDEARIIYRQFQEHGAPNSVDTYFYRGTNRTTMEQMEAIKARGGIINYRGHALTYNLGPIVEKADTIPTAYGTDNGATIGNFVQAKFDTATGKVDGSIYNFLNTDVSADANKFMRQDLVTFNGDVYGNTVTGTATKLGIKPEVGTLTASFYGESANELGGAVNSLTREQGYGDAKWGAVFGATRGTMVDQFNIIEASGNNQP